MYEAMRYSCKDNFCVSRILKFKPHFTSQLLSVSMRVVQGGFLARFTDEKNNESRITDIEISLLFYPVLTLQIVVEEIKID